MPMACDLCGEEPGVLLVSNTGNGDTQSVGPACLPGWALNMAGSVMDPAELVERVLTLVGVEPEPVPTDPETSDETDEDEASDTLAADEDSTSPGTPSMLADTPEHASA